MEQIIQGDCLEVLKTLPDGIVDTCVTSPPYYGLRDYGTGKWIGGDPNCPHRRLSKYSEKTITGHHQSELAGNVGDAIYKTVCPLCGAVREDRQIGLEETPDEYISKLVDVFREVRRVLKDDGTLWVNIGDSYNGSGRGRGADGEVHFSSLSAKQGTNVGSAQGIITKKVIDTCKPKDMIGIPWMLAFALRDDGWYLRQDIIWHKPNPMPEPVKDRCTKSHEYLFLLSKNPRYYFDYEAIQVPSKEVSLKRAAYGLKTSAPEGTAESVSVDAMGERIVPPYANRRDVWSIPTSNIKEAHFATFPEALVEPCIKAGSRKGGVVLDPFFGSGTTGRVATKFGRGYIGIELNPEYVDIEKKRLNNVQTALF